ncbi:TetR/AcrR family transcriptional regulator [Glaciibacter superstes]|uniref:TetR/AcrR family transcriptional regulator n=1 Tax=Glaciibacter superstes TaxID=501023 RepID=UPI0004154E32|nr:TetR/AcrR family transcriptional regulator [Glaciibacter superstes]
MTSSARPSPEGSPSRRRDARANRDRLINEARALIAQNGVDASLEEIARRAEVGVATLYRNFATRDDLVRTLFGLAIEQLQHVQEEIASAPSAWEGIVVFLERASEWLVADPSIPPIMQRMEKIDPAYHPAEQLKEFIAPLIAQARKDGDLRGDVDGIDIGVLVSMVGSLGRSDSGNAGQWRRQLAVIIDGLRAPGHDRPKLPARPTARGASRRAARSRA